MPPGFVTSAGTYWMRAANVSHSDSTHSSPDVLNASFPLVANCSRKALSLNSVRETPRIRASSGSRPLRAKLNNAGTNFRPVRSPEAPKITTVNGCVMSGHFPTSRNRHGCCGGVYPRDNPTSQGYSDPSRQGSEYPEGVKLRPLTSWLAKASSGSLSRAIRAVLVVLLLCLD